MTYELAKQLKDARFPGSENWEFMEDEIRTLRPLPTLSELIEACGDEFKVLERVAKNKWIIVGSDKRNPRLADTPEEAVAKLWLALNKK